VNRVLLIAFHFPPMSGSSGVHRTLKFASYLLEHGWEAAVLTANPRVHPNVSEDRLAEVPDALRVFRSFALDAAKDLSIFGRYPRFLSLPDRWMSWRYFAVPAGRRIIRRFKPDVIWSTHPIASAHQIAMSLARSNGLPWVADFRDPMTEADFPPDERLREHLRRLEGKVVARADRLVFTAPGTMQMYQDRYPEKDRRQMSIIENGYDEEAFTAAGPVMSVRDVSRPIVLLHSGLLYPSERDPTQFFKALAELREQRVVSPRVLQVVLRATGHDAFLRSVLQDLDLEDIVILKPPLPHRKAVAEMLRSDGLLLLQAANCNHQVPAKMYEYFYARKPILALTDPAGDTAAILQNCGYTNIARIDDSSDIKQRLMGFLGEIDKGRVVIADDDTIARYSRRAQAGQLSNLLRCLVHK
jgi:glycosyltransferase involved in cell wall biosynthesis